MPGSLRRIARGWRHDLHFAAARGWTSYLRQIGPQISSLGRCEREYMFFCWASSRTIHQARARREPTRPLEWAFQNILVAGHKLSYRDLIYIIHILCVEHDPTLFKNTITTPTRSPVHLRTAWDTCPSFSTFIDFALTARGRFVSFDNTGLLHTAVDEFASRVGLRDIQSLTSLTDEYLLPVSQVMCRYSIKGPHQTPDNGLGTMFQILELLIEYGYDTGQLESDGTVAADSFRSLFIWLLTENSGLASATDRMHTRKYVAGTADMACTTSDVADKIEDLSSRRLSDDELSLMWAIVDMTRSEKVKLPDFETYLEVIQLSKVKGRKSLFEVYEECLSAVETTHTDIVDWYS